MTAGGGRTTFWQGLPFRQSRHVKLRSCGGADTVAGRSLSDLRRTSILTSWISNLTPANNLTCIQFKVKPITDLLKWDASQQLKSRRVNLEIAIAAYFAEGNGMDFVYRY